MEKVAKNNLPPLMVSCAVTGGLHGKEANPNLPETAEEQADAVYEAYRPGPYPCISMPGTRTTRRLQRPTPGIARG